MSALTLTLSGTTSSLHADFFPPIELDKNVEYVCGLVDFLSYNSIPNVNESNNKIYFEKKFVISLKADVWSNKLGIIREIKKQSPIVLATEQIDEIFKDFKLIADKSEITFKVGEKNSVEVLGYDFVSITPGSYEIDEIIDVLNKELTKKAVKLDLFANKNTMRSHLKCDHKLNFEFDKTIGSILGFHKILEPNIKYISEAVIKISKVNIIRIVSNITNGAYSNGRVVHTIHEFYPSVATGYKIVEVPKNIIYLPIVGHKLTNLTVNIVDQDNDPIDFQGETITLRLHIKKVS